MTRAEYIGETLRYDTETLSILLYCHDCAIEPGDCKGCWIRKELGFCIDKFDSPEELKEWLEEKDER